MRGTMSDFELVAELRIDGEFEGFDEDMLFKLQNGTFWLQDEYKYWYHYAYRPTVELLKQGSRNYLRVKGHDQVVIVRQIFGVIEGNIDGEFKGWAGDTEYRLTNGQVWKQASYKYEYKYAYRPDVLIYEASGGMTMFVEGTSASVRRIA